MSFGILNLSLLSVFLFSFSLLAQDDTSPTAEEVDLEQEFDDPFAEDFEVESDPAPSMDADETQERLDVNSEPTPSAPDLVVPSIEDSDLEEPSANEPRVDETRQSQEGLPLKVSRTFRLFQTLSLMLSRVKKNF
jgi:hypothetical protein